MFAKVSSIKTFVCVCGAKLTRPEKNMIAAFRKFSISPWTIFITGWSRSLPAAIRKPSENILIPRRCRAANLFFAKRIFGPARALCVALMLIVCCGAANTVAQTVKPQTRKERIAAARAAAEQRAAKRAEAVRASRFAAEVRQLTTLSRALKNEKKPGAAYRHLAGF